MKLLHPGISPASRPDASRAPALESLDGKTIGLLSNSKPNADLLLLETAAILVNEYGGGVRDIVHKLNPSAPTDPAMLSTLFSECDYLLTALGDCGSCSTCSMHDGISFEQLGKRTVVMCTTPFEVIVKNIATHLGLPEYPFVSLQHPIGSCSDTEVRQRAVVAASAAATILMQ